MSAGHRYRLEQMVERSFVDCELSRHRWCNGGGGEGVACSHAAYQDLLYAGQEYYDHRGTPALRSAWRRGRDAWRTGEPFHACPYHLGDGKRDRRGRRSHGFAPAFRAAWEAGWAWAEWDDPNEEAWRTLTAYDPLMKGFRPGTPWRADA